MTTITDVEDAFEAAAREHPLALHVVDGDGRTVVSLAGGPSAAIDASPMTVDSPVFLYSVTKAAVGLTAVVAAARGLLDLDAPVADVWPAFGAHGKGEVTVAQALSHGAGVPGWPDGAIDVDVLADLGEATARLADQPAWSAPGTPCEHVYSYGHLVGAILEHATGSRIDDLWQQTVAGPLGLDLVMSPPDDAVPLADPDGVLAAYRWRVTGSMDLTLDGANTAQASFVAPETTTPLTLDIELTVTDNAGASASDGCAR